MQLVVFTQHYLLSTIYSARALEGPGFPSLSHGGSQRAQKCVETQGLWAEMPEVPAEQDRLYLNPMQLAAALGKPSASHPRGLTLESDFFTLSFDDERLFD
ncbi:MAG TPA: hypothetical protein VK687_00250 [Bryobacteraceae bacterium]|nr:hypothetical protein [Bryobacteraceae bacterium]